MKTNRPENPHQAALLRLLRDGPRSRAQLNDLTSDGMSRSKLNAELDRLIELGLAEPDGFAESRGGRRSGLVRLSATTRFAGIDIGATSVDVAVTDGELNVLGHVSEPIDIRSGPAQVLDRVFDLVGKLREQGLYTQLNGAGIGVPGPVSFAEGVPVVPPIMPGWNRHPLRETVSQELGCPAMLDNDVNLMALGELHSGVARQVDDFLLVKIGTGVGCGIVVDGRIYRGVSGSAGDIGHMMVDEDGPVCPCGNIGCLEAYFGGSALAAQAESAARSGASPHLAARLAATGSLTAEDVAVAAAQGDPVAIQLIRDGGRRVGQVLAGLVSFFNPGLVIIAGGVARLGHILLAEIRSVVYRRSLPLATGNLPIVLSELEDVAGVVGAARLISDHVYSA
ncbi:ROK family transcriptional regulator [Herbidospora galbida]|uniref:ROK family transcriptional regulator n=1 Tax=Herbidospora galbida TaxID=2575442 RepID=A0A4V5V080_9ACTN|nr:ROK family transcriptional regulator [Herbidospora galbida]TKK90483.1 ROK family transcriptional regulator [Herbidospora galbida]